MLETLTTIVGSLMGLSFLPQALRIFRLKSSQEVSIFTFSWLLFGTLVWLAYGFSRQDPVLIIANTCGLIGVSSVLTATLYYRKNKK